MPWAARGRRRYFYKSKRLPDGRVGKVYCGGGRRGEQAAQQDATAKARRMADRAEAKNLAHQLEPLDVLTAELDETLNLLATATLFAGGLHQHSGQWRRRRNGA